MCTNLWSTIVLLQRRRTSVEVLTNSEVNSCQSAPSRHRIKNHVAQKYENTRITGIFSYSWIDRTPIKAPPVAEKALQSAADPQYVSLSLPCSSDQWVFKNFGHKKFPKIFRTFWQTLLFQLSRQLPKAEAESLHQVRFFCNKSSINTFLFLYRAQINQ